MKDESSAKYTANIDFSNAILTLDQLRQLPPKEWLVDGVIETRSLSYIYGRPQSYKTFVALSLAFHVTTGSDWLGRPTQKGKVFWVAGEGVQGLPPRTDAIAATTGYCDQADFLTFRKELKISDIGFVDALIEELEIRDFKPTLIVIDTLSRCFEGDENSQRDLSMFVRGCDRLRNELDCAVLVIHHSVKNGSSERGSSVLRGDFDCAYEVQASRTTRTAKLLCHKQRDAERLDPTTFFMAKVGDSLALAPLITTGQFRALTTLEAAQGMGGMQYSEWKESLSMGNGAFDRARNALRDLGLVDVVNKRYSVSESGQRLLGQYRDFPPVLTLLKKEPKGDSGDESGASDSADPHTGAPLKGGAQLGVGYGKRQRKHREGV